MKAAASCLAFAALAALASCDKREAAAPEPQTAQEMYARAQELIRPNVEHAASDFAGALQWLQKAADAGLVQAQTDLAALYLEGGKGVEKNAKLAHEWFSKAAAQGSKEACDFLGILEYEGRGVAQDVNAALAHWRTAADAGIADAQFRLGMVLAQKAESMHEAVDWLVKAARSGDKTGEPAAATALGNIYAKGTNGIEKDLQKSAEWYAQAAAAGEPRAQMVYAVMLLTGEPVPKDEQRGMAMLRLSAGQDNPQAIALLIRILKNSPDAAKNEPEINAWQARLEKLSTGNTQEK
ncbi:MAG: tetratricopeptide repeat protein [Akkermansia sp.]|nr:tetratricopeptide repeat protein [Akkermansia sp.]